MIEVTPARPQHVGPIANRMRAIDMIECATFGYTPKAALRSGLMGSTLAWTVLIDHHPEAMFGVSPISVVEGRGRPWLLMTPVAERQHKALVRLGTIYTAAMHTHYGALSNWIHADNSRSIRWLSRLGYAVGAVDAIAGHPMRPFYRQRTT